jgi:regulatory associated protein of mTOR
MTEVRLINEDDQAFLMTGSSDGVVKLFRNHESPENVELVTSFRALTDLEPSNKNAGLVFDWQQSRGQILVAGDVRSIRVWNAGTEICTSVSVSMTYLQLFLTLHRISMPDQAHQLPP